MMTLNEPTASPRPTQKSQQICDSKSGMIVHKMFKTHLSIWNHIKSRRTDFSTGFVDLEGVGQKSRYNTLRYSNEVCTVSKQPRHRFSGIDFSLPLRKKIAARLNIAPSAPKYRSIEKCASRVKDKALLHTAKQPFNKHSGHAMEPSPLYYRPSKKAVSIGIFRNCRCPHYDRCLEKAALEDLFLDCRECLLKDEKVEVFAFMRA